MLFIKHEQATNLDIYLYIVSEQWGHELQKGKDATELRRTWLRKLMH